MVLPLRRSVDGVFFDSVKNALRVPVLSVRYERYSPCAPHGIVSALQRYSASDIITIKMHLSTTSILGMPFLKSDECEKVKGQLSYIVQDMKEERQQSQSRGIHI